MHHDVRHLAMELIGLFHLNPEAHYPSVLLHYANLLPGADLHALFLLASGYIALRLLESYGLWNDYAWGEWLGALSGGDLHPVRIQPPVAPSVTDYRPRSGRQYVPGRISDRPTLAAASSCKKSHWITTAKVRLQCLFEFQRQTHRLLLIDDIGETQQQSLLRLCIDVLARQRMQG